jgi:hypothetical protein
MSRLNVVLVFAVSDTLSLMEKLNSDILQNVGYYPHIGPAADLRGLPCIHDLHFKYSLCSTFIETRNIILMVFQPLIGLFKNDF